MGLEGFTRNARKLMLANALLMFMAVGIRAAPASDAVALYFAFDSAAPWPQSPTSLLVQSPSFVSVPAGAVLEVHLLRDGAPISTSRLVFQQAYQNNYLVPAVPVASFIPIGAQPSAGQPLPGASLVPGSVDLAQISQAPAKYRLMWVLSTGIMGTPGRAIATGSSLSLIDLKYAAVSSAALVGDQKPGSVLFFNRYSSSASNPAVEDTRLSITNTSPLSNVNILMFLVDSSTCQVSSLSFCLAAQQSFNVQMSDLDPGVKGYVMALAVNSNGEPIQFNWLTGNAVVRQPAATSGRPYASILSAYAVARRKNEIVKNVNGVADLIFNDGEYDRLPGQIAFDSVPSQVNAINSTVFALYRPLADLTGGVSNFGVQLAGWGMDAQNQVISSSAGLTMACYRDFTLASLRLSPIPIGQFLTPGNTAWFVASPNDLLPLMGAQFNSGEFNSGNNGRSLNFAAEYRIQVPVAPVQCNQ